MIEPTYLTFVHVASALLVVPISLTVLHVASALLLAPTSLTFAHAVSALLVASTSLSFTLVDAASIHFLHIWAYCFNILLMCREVTQTLAELCIRLSAPAPAGVGDP